MFSKIMPFAISFLAVWSMPLLAASVEESPVVDCKVSRITVPFEKNGSEVVLAASFVYGAYVKNPKDQDDFLNSTTLIKAFERLNEEDRWRYPEYVVIKYFQEMKAGNKDGMLSCYAAGYDREKEESLYRTPSKQEQELLDSFSTVVFIDKCYFGPYVRIYFVMSGMSNGSTKKQPGFPGFYYLKLADNRYMRTHEIGNLNIIDPIVANYGNRVLMKRETVSLDPNTSGMDWFAMDVDEASPAENKEFLKVYSTDEQPQIPDTFTDNYLQVFVKGEPLHIQFNAGQERKDIDPQLRFFESAVTANQMGTENEILAKWSGHIQKGIGQEIQRLKDAQLWPNQRPTTCLLDAAPTVVCRVQLSDGEILYYKKRVLNLPQASSIKQQQNPIYAVGLRKEDGDYKLFSPRSVGRFNVLTNQMFIDAIGILYEQ